MQSKSRKTIKLVEYSKDQMNVEIIFVDGRRYKLAHPGNYEKMEWDKKYSNILTTMKTADKIKIFLRQCVHPINHSHQPSAANVSPFEWTTWGQVMVNFLSGCLDPRARDLFEVLHVEDRGQMVKVIGPDGKKYSLQHPGVDVAENWQSESIGLSGIDSTTLLENFFDHVVIPEGHKFKPAIENITPFQLEAWRSHAREFLGGTLVYPGDESMGDEAAADGEPVRLSGKAGKTSNSDQPD